MTWTKKVPREYTIWSFDNHTVNLTPNKIHILSSQKNSESNTDAHHSNGPLLQSYGFSTIIGHNDSTLPALAVASINNDTGTSSSSSTDAENSQTTVKDVDTHLSSH